MSMISGGYIHAPQAPAPQVLVVQGDEVFFEPAPGPRFALVMEPPFDRPRYHDCVQIILHMGEVVISLAAAAAQIRSLTQAVVAATEDMPAAEDAFANTYVAGLPDVSGTFSGTFDLTDEELAGLGLPPAEQQAMDDAAKQVMYDARVAARVHPGNTLHVAPGSVSIELA